MQQAPDRQQGRRAARKDERKPVPDVEGHHRRRYVQFWGRMVNWNLPLVLWASTAVASQTTVLGARGKPRHADAEKLVVLDGLGEDDGDLGRERLDGAPYRGRGLERSGGWEAGRSGSTTGCPSGPASTHTSTP